MNNFNIKLPDDVQFIIHTLQLHGFEAYAVGGCVRDSILGREPGDWDITTRRCRKRQRHYSTKHLIPELNMGR